MSDRVPKHGTPEAAFDVLFVLLQLAPVAGGATIGEVQSFAYLACLLSLFEKSPAAAWGYSFTALPPTLPYASDLTDAADVLGRAGLVAREGSVLTMTRRGSAECALWAGLHQLAWRKRYLEGATGASLVTGVPAFGNDLSHEPQLQRAALLGQHRDLLQEGTMFVLFQQFTALREAIGEKFQDLLTPAAVYLAFLSSNQDD